MTGPRVLTFNFHEPYLWLMAKTGYAFTVGQYRDAPLAREWHTKYRPIPKNMTLVEQHVWEADLRAGRFDVVIAHNESNAANVFAYDTPKLLVCHNRLTFLRTTITEDQGDSETLLKGLLERLRQRFSFIFISESKRADYGVDGDVIYPGIDIDEFGGYTGELAQVLRVGNLMRGRNLMFDVDFQERVCEGFPNRVVGFDPTIAAAREAESFEDLLRLYRTHRCLLHVTREAYEDGYNLSTLEAMACGMPVVSLANATSPITDGVDGFASYDANVLRDRIRALFDDPALAREIGARGRETVARKFPISAFVDNWRRAIETAAESAGTGTRPRRKRRAPIHKAPAGAPLNIVMHYVSSPITTGRYIEWAARRRHMVVTAGLRCPEEVLELWGFRPPYPAYPTQQIDLHLEATCREIFARLPKSFHPNVYFWIDSGPSKVPVDVATLGIPKICYLIDTHLATDLRITMARQFDYTFLAQKTHVEMFRNAGVPNVEWLPLACSPELHNLEPVERDIDVAYIGSIDGDPTDRRPELLRRVANRFPNHRIGRAWPEEMARDYARSKIVINAAVNHDVNMRVFEAMASGALLITDEADGLEELFTDGEHLVIYRRDEDLFDLIDQYLRDEDARQRIAFAGATRVREQHTYAHRVETMFAPLARTSDARTPQAAPDEMRFDRGGYYRNVRPEIAQHVPLSTQRLLDVGCGGGDFGESLKRQGVREVYGIELVEKAWKIAKTKLDDVVLGDLEKIDLPFPQQHFDCITCGDVLEHLVDPAAALRKLAGHLAADGVIIMSIPNVRFFDVLTMLAGGRWQYQDAGILDRTHLRFFTAVEMVQMVEEAGLEVLHIGPLSYATPKQLPRNPDGSVTLGRMTLHPADDADYQDLLTYQYLIIAGKPGVDRLARARTALEARHNEAAYAFAAEAKGVDELDRAKIMVRALARLGQVAKAETICREALDLHPDNPELAAELGILLVAMNRAGDAEPMLRKALDLDPKNDRATGALGLVHLTREKWDEAFECLRSALDADFENLSLLTHFIAAARKTNRLPDAAGIVMRFADFYPANTTIACACIELLLELGDTTQARDRLDTLQMLYPNDPAILALAQRATE